MKELATAVLAALAIVSFAEPKTELTPEQKKARKEKFVNERYGGFIMDRSKQKGVFMYLNAQKVVDQSVFAKSVEEIGRLVSSDVQIKTIADDVTFKNAPEIYKREGANAAIFLVDSADYPSMLVAPEGNWAIVNIRSLTSDGASAEFVKRRVVREVWRSFAYLNGSEASDPRSVMQKVNSLKDLDEIAGEQFGPEALTTIPTHLKAIGIYPYVVRTYRAACQLGIAPKPQNQFQQKIWDEIHQLPSNPLRIKPETQRK